VQGEEHHTQDPRRPSINCEEDQAGQHHHRDADREEPLADQESVVEAERPGPVDEGEVEDHEPRSAAQQEPGEAEARGAASAAQERPRAGKEHEDGAAEMRHPAGEEQAGAGEVQVLRVAERAEEGADVIEGQENQGRAAEPIERVEPRCRERTARAGSFG
jgi:hypothetical protein